jgi:hypothetical protein
MKKSIPIAAMALLLAVSGALAQSKSGTTGPSATTGGSGSIPSAPVGHRQPRAADVPSAQEKNYTESAEDKALDRKIKSICRGC